jgi:sulfatase maturation enzyme AslB (radical SAM superfamily)
MLDRLDRRLLVKSVRNWRNALFTHINRHRGREFIPAARRGLSIETSSICNLDCCFCAYPKKQSPRVVMSGDFFQDCVSQALDIGYDEFDLTPCTGDVFMDRHLFDKLAFLERNERVAQYHFFSNFTIPKTSHIEALHQFKKMSGLAISIYGHDLATFKAITKSTDVVYSRLVRNLELLLQMMEKHGLRAFFILHPGADSLRGQSSELLTLLDRFRQAGSTVNIQKGLYNNWGGYVTNDDVEGLPIRIIGPDVVHKNGACVRLFTGVQIMATGIVNGCGARDTDGTLRLGDLHQTPLSDIISARNPAYMELIEEQQNGDFRPVCRSCDFYTSIYHKSLSYAGAQLQTLAEFKASLP